MDELDFEGGAIEEQTTQPTDDNKGGVQQEDTTALNGTPEQEDVTGKDGTKEPSADTTDDNPSTGELEAGTELEFDGATYTVSENGDILDKDGKVFKEAKDVKAWLDSVNVENDDELSLSSIQASIGITVTDENGQPVEFTNDAAGVKNYIDSVIALKANDLQQGAVNKIFAENPMLKQFIDYTLINGGDPRGFGELPDRSGIQLDKDNEAQLEAVVRMAAREFGNNSLNDNYIKYLKSTGGLYDEAKAQLDALVKKDAAVRQQIAQRAEQARVQEQQELQGYWNSVNEAIKNRNINGYVLPESFVKEVNGQKVTLTPNDFFNYLSRAVEVDEEGNSLTGYQRDLNNLSDAEVLNRELLDAWLMFTGGSYKDLISMAAKEDKVKKLLIKSKQQRTATSTVKINKPKESKVDFNDILF